MKSRFRRVAVFGGAAALAAGAGIGVAASSNDSASTGTSRSAPGVTGGQQGTAPPSGGAQQAPGIDTSALAEALGVSESRLEEAMRSTRPTDPSAAGGPDEMLPTLADELGLSVDKVRQAFEDVLGSAGPPQSGGQAAPPAGATSQS